MAGSAKDVGANCFLNNNFKLKIIGPNPATARGEGVHINLHPKEVNKIIYPSGKYIIIKNIDDPSDCFVYRGHSHQTTVAKISPTGYWVASGDISGKLRVWSLDNPEHLTKLETNAFAGAIRDIDWDSESKKLVVVGEGSGVMAKVLSYDTGNSAGEMLGHGKKVLSCAFKPSRPFRIMTCAEDFKVCYYQGPPFKMVHSRTPFTNFANCIRYSPDGTMVVCVGEKKIQLFDGVSGEETLNKPGAHEGTIYSVAWNPEGTKFATCSADKSVKIWNVALDCLVVHRFSALLGDMQVGLVWSKSKLLSLSLNGNLTALPTEAGTELDAGASDKVLASPLQDHQNAISCVCYDVSAGNLYSGDNNGVLIARNMSTGVAVRISGGGSDKSVTGAVHSGKITSIAIVGDSLVSVGFDDTMRFTRLDATSTDADTIAMNGQPVHIATLPGSAIYAVSTSNEVALFNLRTKLGALLLPHDKFSSVCSALASETEIALGCSDFKTRVYSISPDWSTFVNTATIETRSAVTTLAFQPSHDFLAIGDNGRQVEVYEHGTWAEKIKSIWSFHTSKVTCLAWSPNGHYLASASIDECIIVWDFITPSKKLMLPFAHNAGVTSLTWMDDTQLVSVGNDHCIVTWKIPAAL